MVARPRDVTGNVTLGAAAPGTDIGTVDQGAPNAGGTQAWWQQLALANNPVSVSNPLPVTATVVAQTATLNVLAALSASSYNLFVAPYSNTTAIGGPYIADSIKFHFSTSVAKTITVTDGRGTVILNLVNDIRTDFVERLGFGYPDTVQLTVNVSQTASACLMTFSLDIQNGQLPMGGNPIVDGLQQNANNTFTGSSLAAFGTLTGTAADLTNFSQLTIDVFFNPRSSPGAMLFFEFSVDGTNWDTSVPIFIADGNIFIPIPLRAVARYFRLRFINGSVALTAYRITTYLHHTDPGALTRTGTQVIQPTDPVLSVRAQVEPSPRGHLTFAGADRSIGGEGIVMPYIMQDRWQFDAAFTNNNIGVVTTGGATALQTAANGAVLTLPNTATASKAQLQGQKRVRYKPGREYRIEFSVGFSAAGAANVNELYGLTDSVIPQAYNDGPEVSYTATTIVDSAANFTAAGSGVTIGQTVTAGVAGASTATITGVAATTITCAGGWTGGTPAVASPYTVNAAACDPTTGNGFFFGWLGTTFGVHVVSGGATTSFAFGVSSGAGYWDDALDGTGLSDYRNNFLTQAYSKTLGNAFRFRGVWFGVGPLYLEFKSPDDRWVPAFILRWPNTATVPYIQQPNTFMLASITKTAVATTGQAMFTFCAGAGTVESDIGFEPHEINGHKQIQRAVTNAAANQLMHTVSPGRQFLVKTIYANLLTVSQAAGNRLEIRDGGTTGDLRFALTAQRANNNMITQSLSLPVPLVFDIDVTCILVVAGGSMVYDFGFAGYEKEL